MTLHAWRARRGLAAALLALAPAASHACGACAEDQIASTYDHAVVQRAAASGQVMVFCKIAGPFDAARLKAAVRRVRGVEPRSVRVSVDPAAVSFAVDTRQRSPQAAVQAAQRGMPPGSRLTILRLGSS